MSLVRPRSPTDATSNDEPATKKSKSVPAFPWYWFNPVPGTGPFIDKVKTPILDICVGPESKHYMVHKKALTDCAKVFQRMFDGEFAEAKDHSAQFPEDDVVAWEGLIDWSYDRPLGFRLFEGIKVDLDFQSTRKFFGRIKLCCLADKYGMLLLHNLCADSLLNNLYQASEKKPLLRWKVFRECFLYVYTHSLEGAALRRLFCAYFCFMLACPQRVCESTYDPQQMLSLATEIPDLMSDFFRVTHQNRDLTLNQQHEGLWDIDPCVFHIHPRSQSEECPRALGGASSFSWPCPQARIHYYMQERFILGYDSQTVDSLAISLGLTVEVIISLGQALIDAGANLEWGDEDRRQQLHIITPGNFEALERAKEMEEIPQG